MKLDEIRYSIQNLMHRKMRSWLTVLSILIGIMSIFALVSFGLGIQDYVNQMGDKAGRDKLFIMPKGVGAPGTDPNFYITGDEIDFAGKIKGVKDSTGMYIKAGEIEFDKEKRYNFIISFDTEYIQLFEDSFSLKLAKGRHLKEGDVNKVTLGYNYMFAEKSNSFRKALRVGDKVNLNGKPVEVVGFYGEIGNPQDDTQIYMTYKGIESIFPEIKDKFAYVIIVSQKGVNPKELAEKVEEKLRKKRGQEEGKEDFYVQTFDDLLATFGTILDVINGVLILIALISLVVASVNIMNTMYTAVLERTREIGVMKAVGAKNEDILLVFVFESGFLGFIGGVLGIMLGYLVSKAGEYFAASAGYSLLKPIFPWYLVVGCMIFAFLVGALSGLLPARQASKLKPVDALRYE